jgi:hypothetical protein
MRSAAKWVGIRRVLNPLASRLAARKYPRGYPLFWFLPIFYRSLGTKQNCTFDEVLTDQAPRTGKSGTAWCLTASPALVHLNKKARIPKGVPLDQLKEYFYFYFSSF